MADEKRVALVTGGNRGIGLEVCRQLAARGLRVVLGSRDPARGEAAAKRVRGPGVDIVAHPLDVADESSPERVMGFLASTFGRLDVLVNNAGLMPSSEATDAPAMRAAMEVNAFGPMRLSELAIPLMRRHRYGRIVNVSTGMARLTDMNGGWPAYRVSKTALNAITRILADEVRGAGILVNAVDPGWVRTEMGGRGAPRAVEEGAAGIVWAATLPDDGPTGGFFQDGQPTEW